jgi:hypothetical protein
MPFANFGGMFGPPQGKPEIHVPPKENAMPTSVSNALAEFLQGLANLANSLAKLVDQETANAAPKGN